VQSYYRRHLIQKKYRFILKSLPCSYYLLNAELNNSTITPQSSLKLIIYETYIDKDIMTYHDFFFSKTMNKFYLFLRRCLFDYRNEIMVNFVSDGHTYNNYKYTNVHKSKDNFYNLISISDLDKKKGKIDRRNNMTLPFKIINTKYFSPKARTTNLFGKNKKKKY